MSALTFKTLLDKTGIHQNNNYDIRISFNGSSKLVSNLQKFGYDPLKASELLSNCCYQVNPSIGNIQTAQVKTYGEPFEMPYGKTYEPLNIGFYLDNNGDVYKILYLWMETVWNSNTRYLNFLNDYAATISVILTKRDENKEMIQIDYENAYLKSISPIPLNGMSGNTATQFDATFAYRRTKVSRYTYGSSQNTVPSVKDAPQSTIGTNGKTYPGGKTEEQWKRLPPWEKLCLAHAETVKELRANGATEEEITARTESVKKDLGLKSSWF